MDDHENDPSLAEKRRRYFEARDKHYADKKGFRRLDVGDLRNGPQFVMVLLCLLGIALVAFQIFGPSIYQEETDEITDTFPGDAVDGEQVDSGVRLDPDPFRDYLEPLEQAFFNPPAADTFESVATEIGAQLDRFADQLKASQQERRQVLATELETMAGRAREASFDLEALAVMQRDWIQLRSKRFQPADWFQASSQTKVSPLAEFAVYRDVADQLLRHVGTGLSEAEDTIEENSQIGSTANDEPTRAELARRWQESVRVWHDELKALQGQLPERPAPNVPADVLSAIYRLETAFRTSSGYLPADRLPTTQDLEAAEPALDSAQAALEAFDAI